MGRDFGFQETVDTSVAIEVKTGSLFGTQLNDFAFRAGAGPSEVCFGSAMLANHNLEGPNIELVWSDSPEKESVVTKVVRMVTKQPILAGSELFLDYGGAEWFSARGIDPLSPLIFPQPEAALEQQLCLSHVRIAPSLLTGAGWGLFTNRAVKAGDLITTSPVLFLPKKRYIRSNISRYLLADEEDDLALLPIGPAAVINHKGIGANAIICWHPGTSTPGAVKSNSTGNCGVMPDILGVGRKSKEDLVKSHQALYFVSYVAVEDISSGDEIYLNYGTSFNDKGMNEKLLRGGTVFESPHSPISLRSNFFSQSYKAEQFTDSFREDALEVLKSMGHTVFGDIISKKFKTYGEL